MDWSLELKTDEFMTVTKLQAVYEAASRWYRREFFPLYTEHDIDHAKRIAQKVDEMLMQRLEGCCEITENEWLILLAAIYLHDIGMGYTKYLESEDVQKGHGITHSSEWYDDGKAITSKGLDVLRKNHHILSFDLIRRAPESPVEEGMHFGLKAEELVGWVDQIAEVVINHGGTREDFLRRTNDYTDDQGVRLAMLSALLRLGDGLDLDHNRIDITRIASVMMTDESKAIWYSYHYVHEVRFEDGEIVIEFRFPPIPPGSSEPACIKAIEDYVIRYAERHRKDVEGILGDMVELRGVRSGVTTKGVDQPFPDPETQEMICEQLSPDLTETVMKETVIEVRYDITEAYKPAPFALSTILHLLDLMPEMDNDDVITAMATTWLRLSDDGYAALYDGTAEMHEEQREGFVGALTSALRANSMFCGHYKDMMEYFMNDVLYTVIDGDTSLSDSERQRLLGIAEWPSRKAAESLAEAATNPGASPFIDGFYESLELLLDSAAKRGRVEYTGDTPYWQAMRENTMRLYRESYEKHKARKDSLAYDDDQLSRAVFRSVTGREARPVASAVIGASAEQEEADREKMDLARSVVNEMFADRDSETDANIKHRTRESLARLSHRPPVKTPKQKELWDSFDKSTHHLLLPESSIIQNLYFNELLGRNSRDKSKLTADRFAFTSLDDSVAIPEGFNFIHENIGLLDLEQRILSPPYKPFSYRKVHINSYKVSYTDAMGGHETKYAMEVKPVSYFKHLIARKYLSRGYDGYDGYNEDDYAELRDEYVRDISFSPSDGFLDTKAFYLLAGCGVWVTSSDGYLLVARRSSNVREEPGRLGYSASGSCEYSARLSKVGGSMTDLEADPFATASRELYEECGIKVDRSDLELVSFGIDYERLLQQFSFFYQDDRPVDDLLVLDRESISEQDNFAIPFTGQAITALLNNYSIEPGAAISLVNAYNRFGMSA